MYIRKLEGELNKEELTKEEFEEIYVRAPPGTKKNNGSFRNATSTRLTHCAWPWTALHQKRASNFFLMCPVAF